MEDYAYENWVAVILSIGLFTAFLLSFLIYSKKRIDWRNFGATEAFFIALFVEMFGFPLTIFLLSSTFGLSLSFGHVQGHLFAVLLSSLFGLDVVWLWAFVMVTSVALIVLGISIVILGWMKIFKSKGELITNGVYRTVRHPQYLGLAIIILGFLIQWPTIITLVMAPILIGFYYRLARKEEGELEDTFGDVYLHYKARVPMFLPNIITDRREG